MAMPQVQIRLLLLTISLVASSHMMMPLLLPVAAASSMVSSSASSTPCIRKCGEIDIPYPFGMGVECSWPGMDNGFNVTCNTSFERPRAYLFGNVVEISSISVATNEIHIFVSQPAYRCYDSENTTVPGSLEPWWLNTTGTPFLISATKNVFTVIGCYTVAFLTGREDMSYLTGCITTCESSEEAVEQEGETCTGLGCCQTSIHANLSFVDVSWANATNPAWTYSPCNYGFVAQKDWYNFSRRDLNGQGNDSFLERFGERSIPMVLDWAIRNNGSCKVGASGKLTAPACRSSHSECVNATYGGGYICNCSEGYEGNPYMADNQGGCTNINECELRKSNPSKYEQLYPCGSGSTCQDVSGGYKCKCKIFYEGDGKSSRGCQLRRSSWYALTIGVPLCLLVLACIVIVLVLRRKLYKRFNKNGDKLLTDLGIHTFTKAELKKITNGYKKIIGQGSYGKVYKGVIGGNQHVAVKCAAAKGKTLPVEEFMNEITVLFRLNRHTNVVRLVGCCLQTDVPMLVFEFVPKGSLYNILHGVDSVSATLPLSERLGIAIGSAAALTYIHMHTTDGHKNIDMDMHGSHDHSMDMNGGHNHVHGDIKSANILLDDDLKPKISDFGSSKLLTIGYTRSVAADMSYIDPVCLKTGRLTVKSDVYSFGVVLLELITRKEAKYGDNSLPVDFVKSCKKEGNGRSMYDTELLSDDIHAHRYIECLDRIGALAVQCLKEDQDERPAMADVLKELKHARDIAFGESCCDEESSIHVDQAGNQSSMHHGQTTS